jgi:hypothetical protein
MHRLAPFGEESTKGSVKPFDECSVDVAFALRQFDHICNDLFRPLVTTPPAKARRLR